MAKGTKVQATTEGGGRKPSDATRATLSATAKARYAALSPEEKAARLARIGRAPRSTPPAPPPAGTGGPTNPLPDAPGARTGDRPEPQGPVGAPPRFVVPDLPPLELGGDEPLDEGAIAGDVVDAGFGVTDVQVGEWLELPFDLIAERRGAHWRLRPGERDRLAGPIARKINEHAVAARLLGAGGDWALIVGGFVLIINARLAEDSRRDRSGSAAHGPGSSGGAPSPARGDRGDAVRRGAPAGGGRLNGVSLGADDDAGPAAVDPEAPGRVLVQAL
jgi:hypothetical protein